jgi:hypothetical protein
MVSLEICIDIILPTALRSWDRISLQQKYFLGCKGGRWVGLTASPPSLSIMLKSWSRNVMEPSGPVQTCKGIAIPVPVTLASGKFSFLLTLGQSGTNHLPLDGFSWNLKFKYFSKVYRENSNFFKILHEYWVLYWKTYAHILICR